MGKTAEQLKKDLENDFYVSPLSDSQQGEMSGVNIYNENVPGVNSLMDAGAPLRKMYTPEQQQRIDSDQKAFDASQFNNVDISRDPSSDQGAIRDIILGKDITAIPTLPPLQTPSQQVINPNIPMLTDVSSSQKVSNVSVPRPGTTAPQITSEQEVANNIKDTAQYLNNNIKGSDSFYDAASSGIKATMQADEAKALTEANFLAEQQKRLNDALEENAQRDQAARLKADEQIKSMGQIDPDRVWSNRSIWSKMALVAGAALAGKAGSSVGIQVMQDMVAKDIEAQKADMEAGIRRQGSLLEMLKPYATSNAELIKMGNQVGMKMAEKYAEAMKAKVGQGAIPMLAVEKTMREYTKPLLAEKNKSDENIIKISGQEQDRKYNDESLKQKNMELQLANARLRFDKTNMSESDAKRLEAATAMAISAKKMRELEDEKDFDPTAIRSAIGSYMQGKGIPGSLDEKQAEYVANYSNYFSYKRQALTGAAASDKEEERIKLLVAPDKSFRKDAIKLYQKQRALDINGMVNALNAPALEKTKNIPEFNEFMVNRSEANKAKLKAKLKK